MTAADPAPPALRVVGLTKRYGTTLALDAVDVSVQPGELRGLLGPNGAGKTTLLRTLFGLIAPDAGTVELLGEPRGELAAGPLHGVAGFVEDPAFYPYLSGRANLELLARLDERGDADIDGALERVDLAARARDRVAGYSTGMRQRLGIAAALLRRPRLLLLDEPTSGLDPAGTQAVSVLLRELVAEGVAVVLSSHLIGELEALCDSYTIIRAGRVAWDGSAGRLDAEAPGSVHALATSDNDRALAIAREHRGIEADRIKGSKEIRLIVDPGALDDYVVARHRRCPRSGAACGPHPAACPDRKLIAQLPLRLLALACVLGPFAFAAILSVQHGTPADALFGAWVHSSGYALSLVVLSFAANWGFPIIAGVLAGDLFSSEDRHGTWKTIPTRSQSLQDVFAGKVVTAMLWATALAILVAASSVAAGLIVVGSGRFVNLGGSSLATLHALALVVVSWLICLLPVLAYTSLAILFSVITRNGIVGVLGPVLVAVLTQLLALIGNGVWVHLLLVGTAFDAWHGLFAAHPFFGPLVVSAVVCMGWIGASLGASWAILRRREFIAGGVARRGGWQLPARIVAGVTVVIAFLALASNWGPVGVNAPRLRASFGPAFHRLTELQQQLLGHPIPASARYRILPVCNKRQTAAVGPGDWTCTMNVYIVLAAGQQPLTNTPVAYDVSVQSNGCYKASSPPAYVGGASLRDTRGRSVVNPLAVIYGCFNVL